MLTVGLALEILAAKSSELAQSWTSRIKTARLDVDEMTKLAMASALDHSGPFMICDGKSHWNF